MSSYPNQEGYPKPERTHNYGRKSSGFVHRGGKNNYERRSRTFEPQEGDFGPSMTLSLNGHSFRVDRRGGFNEVRRALDILCDRNGFVDQMALVFKLRVLMDLKARDPSLIDPRFLEELMLAYRRAHMSQI